MTVAGELSVIGRACHWCQLVARRKPPEPIRSTSLPDGDWQDLAADFMGPQPSGHIVISGQSLYSNY